VWRRVLALPAAPVCRGVCRIAVHSACDAASLAADLIGGAQYLDLGHNLLDNLPVQLRRLSQLDTLILRDNPIAAYNLRALAALLWCRCLSLLCCCAAVFGIGVVFVFLAVVPLSRIVVLLCRVISVRCLALPSLLGFFFFWLSLLRSTFRWCCTWRFPFRATLTRPVCSLVRPVFALQNLRILDLSCTNRSYENISKSSILELTNLRDLDISRNALGSPAVEGMAHFEGQFPALSFLD